MTIFVIVHFCHFVIVVILLKRSTVLLQICTADAFFPVFKILVEPFNLYVANLERHSQEKDTKDAKQSDEHN